MARTRDARHEVALTRTALLAHGLGGEDAGAWDEERNRLVAELGIAEPEPPGRGAGA